MAKAKEVVKVAAADSELPDYLRTMERVRDKDNFDQSDLVMPRIKLLQGTSPEVETYDKAHSGEFWHGGFDMPLGKELRFVVCARNKKMLLVAPIHNKMGVLARSNDCKTWDRIGKWEVSLNSKKPKDLTTWEIKSQRVEESGVNEWGSSDPDDENSPPAATLFYDYLVLLPDHLDYGPAVLSLARSQIKRGKKGLNDKITLHRNAGRPMQALIFLAEPTVEQGVAGSYYNLQIRQDGFAPKEVYEQARQFSEAYQDFKVADETSTDDVEETKAESDNY